MCSLPISLLSSSIFFLFCTTKFPLWLTFAYTLTCYPPACALLCCSFEYSLSLFNSCLFLPFHFCAAWKTGLFLSNLYCHRCFSFDWFQNKVFGYFTVLSVCRLFWKRVSKHKKNKTLKSLSLKNFLTSSQNTKEQKTDEEYKKRGQLNKNAEIEKRLLEIYLLMGL